MFHEMDEGDYTLPTNLIAENHLRKSGNEEPVGRNLRRKAMNAKDYETARRFKKLLQEKVKLHQAIVFGSRARGDADPESDMDVLVVLDEPRTSEKREIVSSCAWEIGFDAGIVVASVVFSREEWENGPEYYSPFAETVRSEGIPL
ncbi:MAG: nucleotidyltransferase domain-containing protein [Thermodesulfobacteriota bacterium]